MRNKGHIKINFASRHRAYLSCFVIYLFLFQAVASGQSDSLSYAEEYTQDSTVAYLTPMEYAFMFHEETTWLIKVNLLIATEVYTGVNLKMSMEKKIATGISINTMLGVSNLSTFINNRDGIHNYGLEATLESRWYYNTHKKIKARKPVSGLSGSYLSLGAGLRHYISDTDVPDNISNMLYLPVFLRWGIQRRFLKHGYVDLGFKGGYNFALENHSMSYGFFGTYIDAGLAFTRDRQKLDFDKLCPVLKCHAADRFLLKSNLADIISLTTIRRIFIGSVYPNIAAEFKLGSSPFSINTQVGSRVEYATSWSLDYMNIFTLSPRALIEGRYYYNLKRRILTGKTGNGLSANYVSAGAMFSGEYQIFQNAGYRSNLSHAFAGVIVSTGIQRLISNHLYFDLNVGLAYGVENNVDSVNNTNENENKTIFNMGIAIGYRF